MLERETWTVAGTVDGPARPPVVAIVGTNASGKSELAVTLAKVFEGEVVSADSRQVYRDLDIGTGKLTESEMRGVPHHLIDVADVDTTRFSLADFQRLAYRAIDDIQHRGRVPFLAGGTGLYVRAIVEGYQLVAAAPDLQRRAALERLSAEELFGLLATYDKSVADGVDPRNRRRIIRAIEILEQGVDYPLMPSNAPRYRVLQLGITWPPTVLRERIEARLARRMREGMVAEVAGLLARGVPLATLDSLGLEYRHVARLLTGDYRDEQELFDKLRTAIYRFSRRQLSWFRKDETIVWLDTERDFAAEAVSLVRDFLSDEAASRG
jgi:tRNA dimethylallyltransferase